MDLLLSVIMARIVDKDVIISHNSMKVTFLFENAGSGQIISHPPPLFLSLLRTNSLFLTPTAKDLEV